MIMSRFTRRVVVALIGLALLILGGFMLEPTAAQSAPIVATSSPIGRAGR